jgi:hypothetical protein
MSDAAMPMPMPTVMTMAMTAPAPPHAEIGTTRSSRPASPRRAVRAVWCEERAAARRARRAGNDAAEWNHLQRAHILSQPNAGLHLRTHVAMLGFGVRHRDRREIAGQLLRLVVAAPGSLTGRYPVGNTGGADVGALTPMPIPDDLVAVLSDTARRTGEQS